MIRGGHMMVGGGRMMVVVTWWWSHDGSFDILTTHVILSGHSSTKFGELRNIVKHILILLG